MFNFLKDDDLNQLIKELKKVEAHAEENIEGEDATYGSSFQVMTQQPQLDTRKMCWIPQK